MVVIYNKRIGAYWTCRAGIPYNATQFWSDDLQKTRTYVSERTARGSLLSIIYSLDHRRIGDYSVPWPIRKRRAEEIAEQEYEIKEVRLSLVKD